MTREEAIRIFRKEIECLSHTKCEDCILEKACDPMNTTPYDSEYIEAYSMAIEALEQEPTTKNDLGVEKIVDVLGSYTDLDIPYKHKIAEDILNNLPSVTPQQKSITKNDLGVDAVSRQAVLELIADYDLSMGQVVRGIHALPSVTPQEPKTGHWIPSHIPESILDECSECGFSCGAFTFNYCPNCGARMVEPQESEDKE